MCGLAGVASNYVTDKHRNIFYQLMIGAMLRGNHASGLAAVFKEHNKTPDYIYDKVVGTPVELFSRRHAETVLKKHSSRALIGHCRHGTVGSNVRANAHPFHTNNMIGVHNGTIQGKQRNEEYYGTDSECLLDDIDERGVVTAIGDVRGAWALNWFDCRDNTLNFLRNDQRTLFMARKTQSQDLYWSSEEGLLNWILQRNDVRDYEIFLLKEDTHVKFDLFGDDWLSKMETQKVVARKEESRSYSSNTNFPQAGQEAEARMTGFQQAVALLPKPTETSTTSGSKTNTESTQKTDATEKTNVVSNHLTCTGFEGKKISRLRLLQILEHGCINCETVSPPNKPYRFFADTVYLCEECKEDQGVVNMIENRVQLFDDGTLLEDEMEYMQ